MQQVNGYDNDDCEAAIQQMCGQCEGEADDMVSGLVAFARGGWHGESAAEFIMQVLPDAPSMLAEIA